MNNFIWGALARAINDATTIDEAIAIATTAHNDDPDAHLEAGQSLTSHRAAEVIDHLAESVVNDKLANIARSYVAIVGSGLDGDYDTIEAAVAYAASVGGGTILLAPGEYYLSSILDIPFSVNLTGSDPESVIVHGEKTANKYFHIIPDTATGQIYQHFSNITFQNDGGGIFYTPYNDDVHNSFVFFDFCNFIGGGPYNAICVGNLAYTDCKFQLDNTIASQGTGNIKYTRVTTSRYLTSSTVIFHSSDGYGGDIAMVVVDDCYFTAGAATTCQYLHENGIEGIKITNTKITTWDISVFTCGASLLAFNDIGTKSGQSYGSSMYGSHQAIISNNFAFSGVSSPTIDGSDCLVLGNICNGQIMNNGDRNIIKFNLPEVPFLTASTSTTALAFGLNDVVQLTPTSTRTLTTTVPLAGELRSFIILTSGTTSYTLTFGTGFKTAGTLATGAVSGKYFVVNFVSNGSLLIETSRTAAL